ncbi:fish-egg lectin-like [Chanos chanos]|uniref:Fish-egg lectin-like n=1 Tax=Chanos chanos TaxID=29144 RepID=A0A6J2VTA0_CHACN|nr:fish-egg lectin-like [Chanos chanos]
MAFLSIPALVSVILIFRGVSALECRSVPGKLRQIDAGIGQVFGVNDANGIYSLYGDTWTQLPGQLKHVTVGPAGVWGTASDNQIYKLVGGQWVQVPGLLKQIDAGGDQFVAGVNMHDQIFCLGKEATVGFEGPGSPAPWVNIPGGLKYYSCGPISCWGVNVHDQIYIRKNVTPTSCAGPVDWEHVEGSLSMIEVSTDGKVYGVSSKGNTYVRHGITHSNPTGTGWSDIGLCFKSKHVSYDLGHLWVITTDGSIMVCI